MDIDILNTVALISGSLAILEKIYACGKAVYLKKLNVKKTIAFNLVRI
jgi:hypothetical protein